MACQNDKRALHGRHLEDSVLEPLLKQVQEEKESLISQLSWLKSLLMYWRKNQIRQQSCFLYDLSDGSHLDKFRRSNLPGPDSE